MSGESLELARREHGVCPKDGTKDVVRCERCPVHAIDQLAQQQRPGSERRAVRGVVGVCVDRPGVEPRSCSSRLSRERSNPGSDVLEKKKGRR